MVTLFYFSNTHTKKNRHKICADSVVQGCTASIFTQMNFLLSLDNQIQPFYTPKSLPINNLYIFCYYIGIAKRWQIIYDIIYNISNT